MEAWYDAVAAAKQPPTTMIDYQTFSTWGKDRGYISREVLVRNYRSQMAASGLDVNPSEEGNKLTFVCNQVTCDDVKAEVAFADPTILGPANYWPSYRTQFFVYLFGSTADGRSLVVRCRGFEPFFDVDVGSATQSFESTFYSAKRGVLDSDKSMKVEFEYFLAYPAIEYRAEPTRCARIRCASFEATKTMYKAFSRGFTTYNNRVWGTGTYYRDVMNNLGLHQNSWLEVTNFRRYDFNQKSQQYAGSHLFIEADILNVRNIDVGLYRDPSLLCCWDIETYNPRNSEVPMWTDQNAEISLICHDYAWHWSKESACYIAITQRAPDVAQFKAKYADAPCLIVVCADVGEMLKVHSMLIKRMSPSFICGFNDTGYDWPWLIYRALGTLMETHLGSVSFLLRFYQHMCYSECAYFRKTMSEQVRLAVEKMQPIKIAADRPARIAQYLETDGFTAIDMQVQMFKMFARAEVSSGGSLNYFAKTVLQVGEKVDLWRDSPDPAIVAKRDTHAEGRRILRAYDASGGADPDNYHGYIYYCIQDAAICRQMLIAVSSLTTHRAYTSKVFVTIGDSMWRANGLKVISSAVYNGRTLFAEAHGGIPAIYPLNKTQDEQSIDEVEDGKKKKIGGAYVVAPDYGQERESPIIALDIQSLYPSIIEEYNIDHTALMARADSSGRLETTSMLRQVEATGWQNVNQIEMTYQTKRYAYFTTAHHGKRERMGNIPLILRRYMSERSIVKDWALHLADVVADLSRNIADESSFETTIHELLERYEHPELSLGKACEYPQNSARLAQKLRGMQGGFVRVSSQMDFLDFEATSAKWEQEAIKLLMNTFYGVMGASFFMLYNLRSKLPSSDFCSSTATLTRCMSAGHRNFTNHNARPVTQPRWRFTTRMPATRSTMRRSRSNCERFTRCTGTRSSSTRMLTPPPLIRP